ncbi:acyl carrier protein [Actinomadura oligospora]|uniref:acyl carrier protein n=1 Tax=Actinomadura oligospora TaxID=111804 RepID=UPI00047A50DE|nr:acyl carrier protein [Actinomadura oligospora]
MTELTAADLFRMLVEAAGDTGSGLAPEESLDVAFEDLGYDSLALMETSALIERTVGVGVDDEVLADLRTPRELLDLVNGAALDGSAAKRV